MKPRRKVYIVDDDDGVRHSLARLLGAEGYDVATFASAQLLLGFVRPNDRACLVLDVRLPGMTGLEVQAALASARIYLPIIMITGHGDVPQAVQAMRAGAVDFLQKPFDNAVLLKRIREAFASSEKVWALQAKTTLISARLARLSPREREVMAQVVAGTPNKIIAARLGLSPKTVENHRAHLMKKMEAESLAELVQFAEAEKRRPVPMP